MWKWGRERPRAGGRASKQPACRRKPQGEEQNCQNGTQHPAKLAESKGNHSQPEVTRNAQKDLLSQKLGPPWRHLRPLTSRGGLEPTRAVSDGRPLKEDISKDESGKNRPSQEILGYFPVAAFRLVKHEKESFLGILT